MRVADAPDQEFGHVLFPADRFITIEQGDDFTGHLTRTRAESLNWRGYFYFSVFELLNGRDQAEGHICNIQIGKLTDLADPDNVGFPLIDVVYFYQPDIAVDYYVLAAPGFVGFFKSDVSHIFAAADPDLAQCPAHAGVDNGALFTGHMLVCHRVILVSIGDDAADRSYPFDSLQL